MNTLWQDLRYGLRGLIRNPGFTAVAIMTLALGIGANTAIFSVVNAVLLRPLPFAEPDQLVVVWEKRDSSGDAPIPVSGHEFVGWREQSETFEKLAIIESAGFNLTGQGDPEAITGARVSVDYFAVLGVQPALGRTFAPGEDQASGEKLVVLGQKLWQRRFGGNPDVIGKTASLNDQSYTIIGVMPALEFSPDLWMPIDLPGAEQKVGKHSHQVLGRLKPGVTLARAQHELEHIARQLEQQYPKDNVGHGVQLISLEEAMVGGVRLGLLVLLGAVGCVLLIACANVANLQLTHAASRQREMAIRTALGAARRRVIRQLLTESLLLAAIGGGIGLLLALWCTDLFARIEAVTIPRLETVNIDGRVLAATIGFSLLTGLITGIVPAWRTSRPNLTQWLNEGSRSSAGPNRRRMGSLLTVLQVALALLLLIGSGLMLKSFTRLVRVDPGFDPTNVLRLDLSLPMVRYPKARQHTQFYEDLIARLKTLPGVEAVGATRQTPLHPGDTWVPVSFEGRPAPAPGQERYVAMRSISSDYFRVMRIPLRKGRHFSEADARLAVPVIRWFVQQPYPEHFNEPQPAPAVIINETMARTFWPDEDPMGQRIRLIASPWFTVVGVVGDVRHTALHTNPNPEIYLSHQQEPQDSLAVMVRTAGNPLSLADAARAQVRALDKDLPVTVMTMEQVFADSVAGRRFNALLLGGFGVLALALAVVGVFGVIDYSVEQRTREIGVRIAFGAQRKDIFKLIIGQGMGLALLGVGIGLAAAFALTRLLANLLYDVSPTDAGTFIAVSLLLAGVALLACRIPARRAMKVDPIVALRNE